MNAPRDLGPDFREWMRDIPTMPSTLTDRTLDHTRRTRQRRRWLWFLPGPKPTAGADDRLGGATAVEIELHPSERTRAMFSPAKLVGIAAIVAFMGTLAVAVPISYEVAPAPANAPAHPSEITEVEGSVLILSEDDHGEAQTHEWGVAITDQLWTGKWDLDDDRLDGYGRALLNEWRIAFAGGPKSISMYIENDGGSWAGSGQAWSGVGKGGWHHRLVLEGQEGYDGLTAILSADQDYVTPTLEVSGVVFDGGLPPMPVAAPTELGTYGS